MPISPTTNAIIALAATALEGVQGVGGNVHRRPRWAKRENEFIELFFDPATTRINEWSLEARRGTDQEMDYQFRWISQVELTIRGLLGFKDGDDTYGELNDVIDRIRETFHSNAGVFSTPELTQRGITAWESSLALAGSPSGSEYLVHATELTLVVEQIEGISI